MKKCVFVVALILLVSGIYANEYPKEERITPATVLENSWYNTRLELYGYSYTHSSGSKTYYWIKLRMTDADLNEHIFEIQFPTLESTVGVYHALKTGYSPSGGNILDGSVNSSSLYSSFNDELSGTTHDLVYEPNVKYSDSNDTYTSYRYHLID